jgi:tripartite-type tricarboxylate transporter receptor subunit TctC
MRLCHRVLALACLGLLITVPAAAQEFPNRPIRIVVPFPAGGPTDILSRIVAQKMSEDFGQPVVVENRPGANTAIGAQQVARAAPDGYTLLAAMDTTLVMNPATTANLPYDPFKDFAAVTLAAKNTSLLMVRADDGPTTIRELIARGKANPGKLNYGAGIITTRLAGYLFNQAAGIDVQLIPYKGSAEIVQGVLSGSVEFALDSVGSSLPMIESGQFRALAKYSNRPLPQLPDVPSLSAAAELPEIDESATWIGLLAPAGTPDAVLDKLHAEVERIFADPAMLERMQKAGLFPVSSTPAEFDAFIRSETARWGKVIQDNKGFRLD